MTNLKIEGRAALIVNECQLGVVDAAYSGFPGLAAQVAERGILDNIARLADAFRAKGLPVLHTPVVHRPDFADLKPNSLINALTLKGRNMVAGSAEAEYVPRLKPHPGDFMFERSSGLIAFIGTAIDATLRRMGVSTVVLTGVSTNLAIPGNTFAAVEMGYHVVIPEDCIAGADAETHRVIVHEQLRMLARISSKQAIMDAIA